MPLDVAAAQVRADFAQRLLADGELAGFAYLHSDGRVDHLLHPRDRDTGIHHRRLPMIHAIIADLLSPEQGPEARNPEKLALPEDQAVRSRGVQDQAYLSLSHPAGSWVWHKHLKRRICFSEVGPVRQR
jgi:hypothetical protein